MFRWSGPLAAAGLVEVAAHFLSLSWGFTLLTVLFVITGLRQMVNTAQTNDLAARHAALVVQTGAIKDTADTASSTASAAQTTANNAQGTANNAQSTANNALPKGGGTISGSLEVTGSLTIDWDLHVDNYAYITDMGSACTFHNNVGVDGTLYPYGAVQGNYALPPASTQQPSAPGSYDSSWMGGLVNRLNAVQRALNVY
jgi:hypothetical protein